MEKPPYVFRVITHFSVKNIEKYDPRMENIPKLTLEVGSKSAPGTYPLVLIGPFPPFGRSGEDLDKLASLRAEDIESIWAFRRPDDGQWARIEIRGKAPDTSVFVRCDVIEGVPG